MSKQSFEVGARLKAAREKNGLSRHDVAKALGKRSERTIRRYERGENLTIPVFEELCALYKVESIHMRFSQEEITQGFLDSLDPNTHLVFARLAEAIKRRK